MNNNYRIIRTICENVFQRILECRDNDTGAIFYSNIITSKKVINLINVQDLKKLKSNILECYSTEDRVYIFTKSLESDCRKLTDLAKNLTMKQQFDLAEKAINLASDIFNMTDVVQQKIMDLDKLYIDGNNDLIVDCNLIFEQEYDIADNETFKRLGNIIHVIFSGTEIIDYNISDNIPPDVIKIIVRCITREYVFPKDALKELNSSPIFTMIFGEETGDEVKEEPKEPDIVIHDEDSNDYLNIYLEDEEPAKREKAEIIKDIKRAAVSLLIVVIVLLAGTTIIKKLNGNEASAINNDPPVSTPENPPGNSTENPEENPPAEEVPDFESTDKYLSGDLLEKIGYEGTVAQKDKEIYIEGNSSLMVENPGQEKVKALFAAVDFTDEDYNYLLMRQIGISGKIKSQTDTKAQLVFEAYKDEVMKSNFHALVNVYDDIWSQFTVSINVTDADVLRVYLEYEGENKVWIDSLLIDVIK
jgi:succinate dehydrogenase flavin-adding protein (antitoxin of CptAB toxin-antitoxin module)